MPKRKAEEVVETTYEIPVPISSQAHMWLRGSKLQVVIEYFAHGVGEDGMPNDTTNFVVSLSPQQFKSIANSFAAMVERLDSVGTH